MSVFGMPLRPEFDFSPLHGLALVLPLLLARFGVLLVLNRRALRAVDLTPTVEDNARWSVPVYMLSEGLLVLYPFFLTIKANTAWFVVGLPFMVTGLVLVLLSVLEFARGYFPLTGGIYRYSRNPMYVGYFLYFVGVGLVTASWLYLALAVVEQIGMYWLIRGEERWCLATYGEPYRRYTQEVRRYLGRVS